MTKTPYPANLVRAIGIPLVIGETDYRPLTDDELALLEQRVEKLPETLQQIIELRFRRSLVYREIAEAKGCSMDSAQREIVGAVRTLRLMYRKE